MHVDFRHILRQQTSTDHDRVDALMSGFDVATRDGLLQFLGLQLDCFEAMIPAARGDSVARHQLLSMTAAIRRDFATLVEPKQDSEPSQLNPLDPLALDYIIEGSRLGTKMLKRRWAAAKDPQVSAAKAYFSFESEPGRWRQVCNALSEITPDSTRATAVIADTATLFELFRKAATVRLAASARQKETIA